MIVLLGGAIGEYLEEETFYVEGTLFPGGEVEGEVSIVVGDGGGIGVGFEESFGDFNGGTEGCSCVEREIATIVLYACFMSIVFDSDLNDVILFLDLLE